MTTDRQLSRRVAIHQRRWATATMWTLVDVDTQMVVSEETASFPSEIDARAFATERGWEVVEP